MRQDQIERLRELEETLIDVYLDEADPANWPGDGNMGDQLTKRQRGDRYWDKKNAVATVVLAQETRKLIANSKEALGRDAYDDSQMDKQIEKAEREADALLAKIGSDASRSNFLKRSSGEG